MAKVKKKVLNSQREKSFAVEIMHSTLLFNSINIKILNDMSSIFKIILTERCVQLFRRIKKTISNKNNFKIFYLTIAGKLY